MLRAGRSSELGHGALLEDGRGPGAVHALLTPRHAAARLKRSPDLKVTPLPGARAGGSRNAGWGRRGLPPWRPARSTL